MTNDEGAEARCSFLFFVIRHSSLSDSSESLRMPVRFRDGPFTFVFEKFVDRGEEDAGAAGFDPDIKVELVLQEMDVAMTDHAEEFARNFEVVRVNNAVLDRENGFCLAREAVARAGNNGG